MYVALYEDSAKERLLIIEVEPDDVDDDELVIDPNWPVTRIQALAKAHYDRLHANCLSAATQGIYERLCQEAYGEEREGDYSYWPAAGNPSWVEEHDGDYGSWFPKHGKY